MDTANIKFKVLYYTLLLLILLLMPGSRYIVSQEKEECEDLEWRRDWFYNQRMFPYDSIPSNAYINSINQKNNLVKHSANDNTLQTPWTLIGPQPFFGSCQVNPNPQWASGRIADILYDPRSAPGYNTIWIASANGGVWKTTDGGFTWLERNGSSGNPSDNLPTLNSGSIAIDEERNIIYYGTGVNIFLDERYMGMGLFRSTNEGLTWENISNGLIVPTQIFKIAIDPRQGMKDHIFIADRSGLFETSDGGQIWKRVSQVLPPNPEVNGAYCTDVCFAPGSGTVYATGPSRNFWPGSSFNGIGFWISSDYGVTYSEVSPASNFPIQMKRGRTHLAVPHLASPLNNGLLYVMTYDNDDQNIHVYRTMDYGANFVNIDARNVWHLGGNAGYNQLIRCSDLDPNICFMGYQELFRTTNGTASQGENVVWSKVAGSGTDVHMDFHTLDFKPSYPYKEIAAGDDGGVHISGDLGNSWVNKNNNLCLAQIYRLSSDVYNPEKIVIGLQDQGIGYRDINSSPAIWRTTPNFEASCGDGSQVVSSPFITNHFIAGNVVEQCLFYSKDGVHFNPSDYYRPNHASGHSIAPVVNHPNKPGTAYTVRFNITSTGEELIYTPIYLLKTTDYGVLWREDESHPYVRSFKNPYQWGYNTLIAISQSNPDYMIIDIGNPARWNHTSQRGFSRLLKTTNGGLNWYNEPYGNIASICKSGENGLPDRFITHVEFSPTNPDTIFLTVSGFGTGHIYRSTDGGFNWTNISDDLPDSPVNDLIIIYNGVHQKQLWIATDVGVFYKEESSNSWIPAAPLSLPNCPILDLDYNRFSGKLRASAFGRGIWEVMLEGPIYVNDRLYITDIVTIDKDIVVCPGGELIIGQKDISNNPFTIKIQNGHKITVMNGGKLTSQAVNQIALNSDTYWDGITVLKGGIINLKKINFINSNIPISIKPRDEYSNQYDITINNCVFNNGTLEIMRANNIYIGNSVFQKFTGTAVNILYGKNITFENNSVIYSQVGISFLNSIVTCKSNKLVCSEGNVGINMHDCYSSFIKDNTITNYSTGINLLYCTPHLYKNIFMNSGMSAVNSQCSYPSLSPEYDGNGNIIWAAGKNVFTKSLNDISIYKGVPDIRNGNNRFNALKYYLYGTMPQISTYYAENNCWDEGAIVFDKFHIDVSILKDPYQCNSPDNASVNEGNIIRENDALTPVQTTANTLESSQNIIINLGNGHFDTVNVTQGSITSNPEEIILARGIKEELLGNYQNAISSYQKVVELYQSKTSSMTALYHIMACYDKQNSDTNAYSNLRTFYQNLTRNNYTDTAIRKIATGLANKTYVKQHKYPEAITAYENEITNSTDTSEILNSEINIIEIYMLMNSLEGDSSNFTGRLAYLKPANNEQAYSMILNRMMFSMNIDRNVKAVPMIFTLSQNYPNPFNPITRINYTIPVEERVTITVYDILGRTVKVLVNENQKAGYYTVVFDGKNYASGVYFYRFTAGYFSSVKKMILVK